MHRSTSGRNDVFKNINFCISTCSTLSRCQLAHKASTHHITSGCIIFMAWQLCHAGHTGVLLRHQTPMAPTVATLVGWDASLGLVWTWSVCESGSWCAHSRHCLGQLPGYDIELSGEVSILGCEDLQGRTCGILFNSFGHVVCCFLCSFGDTKLANCSEISWICTAANPYPICFAVALCFRKVFCAFKKCVLKVARFLRLAANLFHSLMSSAYRPVLKTISIALDRIFLSVYGCSAASAKSMHSWIPMQHASLFRYSGIEDCYYCCANNNSSLILFVIAIHHGRATTQ
jgi:hypothetical protein